ncbi:MAG: prepilin-type N-terminal cleavage/methylation domain-containing protein [Candidatus Paceibacterota bacterium]|jgi:prepilin-type N-terminal cleavage/methylation domain-containing protein
MPAPAKIKTAAAFSKGFSLIEISIVLLVLSIFAGIGYFGFYESQSTVRLAGISRDLVADLRYAQQLAVSQQIKYGVRFYSDEKKYEVVQFADPEQTIKTVNLPEGIEFQQIDFTNSQVKFNIYGAATEAGNTVLKDQGSNIITIEIKPSGFVKTIK